MYVYKLLVPFLLVLFAASEIWCIEQTVADPVCAGYETISTRLDNLQEKLNGIESAVKKNRDTVDHELCENLKATLEHNLATQKIQTNGMIKEHRESIDQQLAHQSNLSQQLLAAIDKLSQGIQMFATKEDLAWFKSRSEMFLQSISLGSCKEQPMKRSGTYFIKPTVNDEPFLGYCGETGYGGAWLVIQHRYDGTVDFHRNWTAYRNGFGSVDGEFWLGLKRLHRVISTGSHTLMVELRNNDGNFKYALYSDFAIGSEEDKYPITKLGSYTGTAGDALGLRTGQKFSTGDRDYDSSASSNCAAGSKAAWWYDDCFHSNVNGVYGDGNTNGFRYTRMLVRKN